ncbi:AFG1-like ATPase-domain-containing protein [Hyaloraphidium curvatum]|nr:AFG1-like ATPase-domain-containing protein [Hyaloraphidium curvatum]
MELYRSLVSRGVIRYDEGQFLAVRKLQSLFDEVADYAPRAERRAREARPGPGARLHEDGDTWSTVAPDDATSSVVKTPDASSAAGSEDDGPLTPKGIFLHGPVGTGKSLLLNLFHDSLPTHRKRRVHFHAFMQDLYGQMHRVRTRAARHPDHSPVAGSEDAQPVPSEPHVLLTIALGMVRAHPVLMLDEFQAPDPATTSILSVLLEHFFSLGGVLLATSNKQPGELGTLGKGLGRVVQGRMDGVEVGGRDWRGVLAGMGGEGAQAGSEEAAEAAARQKEKRFWVRGEEGWEEGWAATLDRALGPAASRPALTPFSLPILSRALTVPQSLPPDHRACLLPFSYLLTPLGPLDVLHLCRRYDTLVLPDLPLMGLREREAARRLITLLDAAYEGGCAVYVLADREPERLFRVKQAEKGAPVVRAKPFGGDGAGEWDLGDREAPRGGFRATRGHRAAVSDEAESGGPPDPRARQPAEAEEAAEEGDDMDIMLRETVGAAMAITARDLAYRRRSPFSSSAREDELVDRRRIDRMTIFTAEDELFAFKRASSRLREMCWSPLYWERSGGNRELRAADNVEGLGGSVGEGQGREERYQGAGAEADWGDEASYAGYLKQFTRFNPDHNVSGEKKRNKPFAEWHFFGMQDGEDSWSVRSFFRQLRKRYEPPPAGFKVKEKGEA